MSDQFGTIFVSTQFDDAVEVFLKKWTDTYLSRVENQLGIPSRSYTRPKSWSLVFDENSDKWPEDKLPSIMVASAGFDGTPQRLGHGVYAGWWNWTVIAFVSLSDYAATRRGTQVYQAALRTAIVQHPDLEGAVGDTQFVAESLDYASHSRSSVLGVAALEFRSFIECIAEENEGPIEPDEAPPDEYQDWPTVQTVAINVESEPLDD